jgi:MFS family permease
VQSTEQMSPKGHPRFFYGWAIVFIAIVGGAFTSGASVWGASIFVTPMGDEPGWSWSAFFGAFTVRALVAGVIAPVLGPLQDTRNGPRLLMLGSALSLGTSLVLLKYVSDLWVFYLVFGSMGALSMVALSEMLTVAIVPKWFIRKRGRAMGLASIGTAMGPLLFPISVQAVVSAVGWRDGWLVLGLVTLAVLVPLSFLIKTRPEDMGLLPDGEESRPPADDTPKPAPAAEVSFTRREAARTPTFWLLAISFSLATLSMGGFFANWLPYFQDIGFSAKVGSLAAIAYCIGSISIRLVWGLLSERYSVRHLLVVQALLTAVSVYFFLQISGSTTLVLAGGFHGLAVGGFFIMRPLIIANYFGRLHLGAVNSLIRPLTTITGSLSPLMVAGLFDVFGTYTWAFTAVLVAWLLVAAIVGFAKPPRKDAAAADPAR